MANWEYKTLVYGIEGKVFYSNRFWVDVSTSLDEPGNRYGPTERSRLIGKIFQAMKQLEEALKQLDEEGWELVSTSFSTGIFSFHGMAVLRKSSPSSASG